MILGNFLGIEFKRKDKNVLDVLKLLLWHAYHMACSKQASEA